jgi:transposase
MLQLHLTQIAALEAAVQELDARLEAALAPFRAVVDRLITIPGVSQVVARVLVAEIGPDPEPVPDGGSSRLLGRPVSPAARECRQAALHPRAPGYPGLKTTLVQAAGAAVRTKRSYLQAQFLRLKSRRGPKKAFIAVAASMLTAVYHMLTRAVPYHDLGADHFQRRDHAKLAQRLVRRLRDLGFTVALQPAA